MVAQLDHGQILATAAVFTVCLAVWTAGLLVWRLRRARQSERIQRQLHLAETPTSRELRLWHEGQEATTLVPVAPRQTHLRRLEQLMREAGWNLPVPRMLGLLSGLVLVTFWVLMSLFRAFIPAAAISAAIPLGWWFLLKQAASKRKSLFERQFVDALELAARSLRAGHPLIASFRVIEEEVDEPVGSLFGRICQQQALGVSLEESLQSVSVTAESEDLKLFAASVAIQIHSGGSLADLMTRLACVIRERLRLSRHVRVLIAQSQLSKRILLLLPVVLFLVINMINPQYMQLLYTTTTGKIMLGLAAGGLMLGAWTMNRMARVTY